MMSIGAEVSGLRVVEVLADVGDRVHKGQLIARLDDSAARVDLSIQQAALAEAQAASAQSEVSLRRAKRLSGMQVLSQQDLLQAQTNAKADAAKLAMAEAQIAALQLKIRNTRVVAPDDGIVAARSTSVGALVDGSTELYKLIRNGRIEWRAQLRPEQQARVEIGQKVQLRDPLGHLIEGRVRQIAPTADDVSRTSLVYVDVPPSRSLEPGVLVSGEFQLPERTALVVPYGSLVLRDGFIYVMTPGPGGLVRPIKVRAGEQRGQDIEIVAGLSPHERIIARGVEFLHPGDRVKVIQGDGRIPMNANSTPTASTPADGSTAADQVAMRVTPP